MKANLHFSCDAAAYSCVLFEFRVYTTAVTEGGAKGAFPLLVFIFAPYKKLLVATNYQDVIDKRFI